MRTGRGAGGEAAESGAMEGAGASADGGEFDSESVLAEEYGDGAPDVLNAVADLSVNETPPVELMAKVQEWQERLTEE